MLTEISRTVRGLRPGAGHGCEPVGTASTRPSRERAHEEVEDRRLPPEPRSATIATDGFQSVPRPRCSPSLLWLVRPSPWKTPRKI